MQSESVFLLDFYFYSLQLAIVHMQINFLSQIRLSNKGDGPKVAKRLIDVYFAVFKVLLHYINCTFCMISWLQRKRSLFLPRSPAEANIFVMI